MAITVDKLVEDARCLPREQMVELVDRLTLSLYPTPDPEVESAWKTETRRRLAEIENGEVQEIPGNEVSDRVRRIVGR
jgi:putative addiction module component (TIGR02574 family)